jgi:hypothetical protein
MFLSGCSASGSKKPSTIAYPFGAQVPAFPFIYTAVDQEWRDQLTGIDGVRSPKHRFLLVSLSITNSGGEEAAVPLLEMEDSKGNTYAEETSGDGVPQWLGYLRRVKPANTEQGRIVFDVPAGAYKLRVSSGGDPEQEKYAMIEIPFVPDKSPVDGGASEPPLPTLPAPPRK